MDNLLLSYWNLLQNCFKMKKKKQKKKHLLQHFNLQVWFSLSLKQSFIHTCTGAEGLLEREPSVLDSAFFPGRAACVLTLSMEVQLRQPEWVGVGDDAQTVANGEGTHKRKGETKMKKDTNVMK